jgi:hypothetical protein
MTINFFIILIDENEFFLSSFITNDDNYTEKHVDERRRKGLSLYEHYCESTDRCKCGDCHE